jgi:hypothetical protein
MNQRKFIFIKEYSGEYGKIPQGTELIFFRGFRYMNGGRVHPAYQKILLNIIQNEDLKEEYLKEVRIINNKI